MFAYKRLVNMLRIFVNSSFRNVYDGLNLLNSILYHSSHEQKTELGETGFIEVIINK